MCVCARARERERERGKESSNGAKKFPGISPSSASHSRKFAQDSDRSNFFKNCALKEFLEKFFFKSCARSTAWGKNIP